MLAAGIMALVLPLEGDLSSKLGLLRPGSRALVTYKRDPSVSTEKIFLWPVTCTLNAIPDRWAMYGPDGALEIEARQR